MAEAIGEPRTQEFCGRSRRALDVGSGDTANPDVEAIALELAGAELLAVALGLEDADAGLAPSQCLSRVEPGHREALPRDCESILATRIADFPSRNPRERGEPPGNLFGVPKTLLHPEERVPSGTARRIQRDLLDDEVLGRVKVGGQSV